MSQTLRTIRDSGNKNRYNRIMYMNDEIRWRYSA